jgi:hypothetical protein
MARVEVDTRWEAEIKTTVVARMDSSLGPQIAGDARRYAPIGPSWGFDPKHPRVPPHQGGELKASIGHHMEGARLIVDAKAPYSAYVEEGTSPHPITSTGFGSSPRVMRSHALGSRTLWSLWNPVTNTYFGSHVNHPGTRPQPFLRTALYQERVF